MSRIGKKPVAVPSGVTASVNGQVVSVKGTKGELRHVLVDDIISTGRTLVATATHLGRLGFPAPVCLAVHAVFAGDAEDTLDDAGLTELVTCDTIPHRTNRIAVDGLLVDGLRSLLPRL